MQVGKYYESFYKKKKICGVNNLTSKHSDGNGAMQVLNMASTVHNLMPRSDNANFILQ